MEFIAKQIAEILSGKIEGDENAVVSDFSKIEEGKPNSISFLANPKYNHYIYETQSSVVLVNEDFIAEKEIKTTLIRVPDAYKAIAILLNFYNSLQKKPSGIEKPTQIHKTAKIGKKPYIGSFTYISKDVEIGNNVQIYPNCYIGSNVKIGDNTIIYSGVNIYSETKIGKDCVIHSGTVIGADGFGFAPVNDAAFLKIAQIGNVVIEDNVELGALVTVDRATMGSTIIRTGVRLDDHNHVAHNVDVGENTVIAAQGGIAGSTKIGKNCMFAGQIGIAPHVSIANNTILGARAAIPGNIKKEGQTFIGQPGIDPHDFLRASIHFKNFDKIVKRLEKLEKIIEKNNISID
ncbi:MAG: UDP-3-O-(3-hydroxymyristoyl)glucosamine N-acyltransferase [Bacteroidales bacterium]|jgi:UDP-3-O-[3-hydroxymyristoyl] glucosamine N-acyltransferase|nr:UDP-3-O-(3-hydroxymyristoyl)glucosamine N-acyltransferase [Bacteroidales bacterium]